MEPLAVPDRGSTKPGALSLAAGRWSLYGRRVIGTQTGWTRMARRGSARRLPSHTGHPRVRPRLRLSGEGPAVAASVAVADFLALEGRLRKDAVAHSLTPGDGDGDAGVCATSSASSTPGYTRTSGIPGMRAPSSCSSATPWPGRRRPRPFPSYPCSRSTSGGSPPRNVYSPPTSACPRHLPRTHRRAAARHLVIRDRSWADG